MDGPGKGKLQRFQRPRMNANERQSDLTFDLSFLTRIGPSEAGVNRVMITLDDGFFRVDSRSFALIRVINCLTFPRVVAGLGDRDKGFYQPASRKKCLNAIDWLRDLGVIRVPRVTTLSQHKPKRTEPQSVRRNSLTEPANISPANSARKATSGSTTRMAAPLRSSTRRPCTAYVNGSTIVIHRSQDGNDCTG